LFFYTLTLFPSWFFTLAFLPLVFASEASAKNWKFKKRAWKQGCISAEGIHQRLMSWVGHAGQADSTALIRSLAAELKFENGKFVGFADQAASLPKDFRQAPSC
jgi:hypothetical protein